MNAGCKLRVCGRQLKALIMVLLIGAGAIAQDAKPQLRTEDRIRLAEAFRLAEKLGDRVWRGWSKAPFAVLLVTPEYEFLMHHPQPSKDFMALGFDPLLKSEIYYRKPKFDTHLLATFPAVGGVSTIVIGQPENTEANTSTRWVVTLLHEHFHQMQDSAPNFYAEANALGLSRGDQTGMWMLNFPFAYGKPEVKEQFSAMSRALSLALRSRRRKDFNAKLSAYLASRKHFEELLVPDDYRYLSFQLWKEGVARYTEYRMALEAAARYRPTKKFASLKDFTPFKADAGRSLNRIMTDLSGMSLEERGRTAFYPFGAAEAMLLDRANRKWKRRYFAEKFYLDRYFTR
ncbi:MAG TPA: hypothetical protein VM095_08785 [Pyrinomonadaceae bacterium]|nr:hypothetical protein [Pyrinomonadaceae bacterium]